MSKNVHRTGSALGGSLLDRSGYSYLYVKASSGP